MTIDPNDPQVCGVDQDDIPDHEAHRGGKQPKAKLRKRVGNRFGLVGPCAIPGVSLTNYNLTAQQKGWGPPCTGNRTLITLSNGVRLTVRAEIATLALKILNECIRRGYVIRPNDTGAYNCRYISGTTVWSNHAWAVAIDINWQTNPYTSGYTHDIPDWMAKLFNRYGFAWGGDYSGGKRDYMHFEFMGSPAQAAVATDLASRELGGEAPPPPPGDGDPQVRKDQFDLNDTGFTCSVDGFMGPETVQRIKDFQWSARRPVTGVMSQGDRDAIHTVPSWHSAGPTVADDPGGYSASQWQQKLKDHGWNIAVDNSWGAHSKSILQQFQAEKGIVADGNRGPSSWTCLYCTVN
jgi:hypothetical protein